MKKYFYILFSVLIVVAICFSVVGCDSNVKIVVRFESNGGSEIDSVEFVSNDNICLPDNPVKEGFMFDGWYEDNNEFNNPFELENITNIKEDKIIILYAKWIPEIYVNFESNGGTNCEKILINQLSFTLPTPTKSDYKFSGWFLDNYTFLQEFSEKDLENLTSNEITLYAKWEKISLSNLKKTVYYISNDNLPVKFEVFTDKLDLYQPYVKGKYFDGWYFENTFDNQAPDILTKEMFNFGKNYVYLYAKFITKEIYTLNIVGAVKIDYNVGEDFDANGAKLYVSYLDKNFEDESFDIDDFFVKNFFTQINDESLKYLTKVNDNVYKGKMQIGLNEKSIEFEYFVHINNLII